MEPNLKLSIVKVKIIIELKTSNYCNNKNQGKSSLWPLGRIMAKVLLEIGLLYLLDIWMIKAQARPSKNRAFRDGH